MEAINVEKLHREHVESRREAAAWVDDLRRWKQEHLRFLRQLEKALKSHDDMLDAQRSLILDQQQLMDRHEHLLVQFESKGESALLKNAAFSHQDTVERHDVLRGEHAKVKKHQQKLMSTLSRLIKEIDTEAKLPDYPRKRR